MQMNSNANNSILHRTNLVLKKWKKTNSLSYTLTFLLNFLLEVWSTEISLLIQSASKEINFSRLAKEKKPQT